MGCYIARANSAFHSGGRRPHRSRAAAVRHRAAARTGPADRIARFGPPPLPTEPSPIGGVPARAARARLGGGAHHLPLSGAGRRGILTSLLPWSPR